MPTVDLTDERDELPAAGGALEGLPRRVALTLPELRLLAEKAGGAPLPFEVTDPAATGHDNAFENRLGGTRLASDDQAYVDALATLHDPAGALARRGLLDGDDADAGVVGALGLLATPHIALDLDVTAGSVRGRAWHRQRGGAVAALASVDGIVFELAWFESEHWAAELARMAVVPEDLELDASSVPALVDLPYELLDAGAEALRTGRSDLLSTVVAHHAGSSHDDTGRPLDDVTVAATVAALVGETRGRLRALVADVDAGGTPVGVVSWVLLEDGWRVLRPHQVGDTHRVELRRVDPTELAAVLGPVVAEVSA